MGKDYKGALQALYNVTVETFHKAKGMDAKTIVIDQSDVDKLLSELAFLQNYGYVQFRQKPERKEEEEKISFTSGLKNFVRKVVNANVKPSSDN